MPYALLLHLAISIWMYGNKAIFVSEEFKDEAGTGSANAVNGGAVVLTNAGKQAIDTYDPANLSEKLLQQHVLPLVFMLVVYSGYLLALEIRASLRVVADLIHQAAKGIELCIMVIVCNTLYHALAEDGEHEARVAKHTEHNFEFGDMLEADKARSFQEQQRAKAISGEGPLGELWSTLTSEEAQRLCWLREVDLSTAARL